MFAPCERAVARAPRTPRPLLLPAVSEARYCTGVPGVTGAAEAQCLGVAGVLLPAGDAPFDPCQKLRAPRAAILRRSQSIYVQTGV